MLTENLYLIALLTGNVGDIDHRYVHADITHVLSLLTMYQTVAMTVAKMTVKTVGIADRNSGNHRVALDLALAAVAYGVACRDMAELEDGGF